MKESAQPTAPFPLSIQIGDDLLVRARVTMTDKYRPGDPTVTVKFSGGYFAEIPLDAAFGIIEKPFGRPVTGLGNAFDDLGEALRDVAAERRRQIEVEGWTPEHDDEHADGEMADAAAAYAIRSRRDHHQPPYCWPWDLAWFKHSTPRHMLVKAGALILAEIERLDRSKP